MTARSRAARLVAALALGAAALAVVPASSAAADPVTFADAAGIHVVSSTQVDGREVALSVSSAALGRAVRLRVLLPTGYDPSASTRYPVLYLFHGTSGGPDDWIDDGAAEATTAGLPLIVVLPDAGFYDDGGGWFTNWVDTTTALGPSQWETFHVGQLVPWVDANLDTVADRSGRAIAGLSQGGFGAASYAARHPDTFGAFGTFSGAPEIDRDPYVRPFSSAIISGTAVFLDGVEPDAMFGSRLTNEINWQGHDPAALIDNLHDTDISMWTATGLPGQYDTTPDLSASAVEFFTHVSTVRFHQHLDAAGVPNYLDDYVFGTHIFPYWADDLRAFVPRLMQYFAHPPAAPTAVTYTSVDKNWTQWGWTVQNNRTAPQAFSELSGADAHGFVFTGRGSAAVRTPAFYAPLSAHAVRVVTGGVAATSTVVADATGSLTITVTPRTSLLVPSGTATVTVT
jgi:S-formylglutathione hydrolase FrmB